MSAFTPEAAARLAGPDWLRQRRQGPAEQFAISTLPSWEEEVWRYSPIDELDLDRYAPVTGDPGPAPAVDLPARAGLVVCVDGHIVDASIDPGWAAKGVSFGLADDPQALGRVLTEPTDVFATMNDAFVGDPVLVRVPRGVHVDEPLVVVNWILTDGAAVFPRLVVAADSDSSVEVLDVYRSADVTAFAAPVVEIDTADAARVGYLAVQDLGEQVTQIGSTVAVVGQQGALNMASAGLGGKYARLRCDTRLVGRGSTGDILAAYFGDREQVLDYRTFQEHVGRDTTSDLLFKGAVDDSSRSVYTGLIRVRPDAAGTNAFQTNRNIKLSEDAWAESVPNLEIENNDVRCSHASTVGPVDEDQLFYLESRGVPPAVAAKLIVAGFFDEVLDAFPVAGAVPAIGRRLEEKLA